MDMKNALGVGKSEGEVMNNNNDTEDHISAYLNPAMENYEVVGQMSIFDFIPSPHMQCKEIPFEQCMNPPE